MRKKQSKSRTIWPFIAVLALLTCGIFVLRLCVGVTFGWPAGNDSASQQILQLRLCSAIVCVTVGVCLSTSGVYLQTLLRNPLASPYILGLAAGATLGIGLTQLAWTHAPSPMDQPWWSQQAGATAGAFAVLLIVFVLSQRRGIIDPMSMLLVGVIVSAICGSLIILIEYLLPGSDTDQLIRWMMGTIPQGHSATTLWITAALAAVGLAGGLCLAGELDAAALRDDEALSVGVQIGRTRIILYILAGILAAVSVSLAGPIGFVGLIAPHIARRIISPHHAPMLVGAALIGALLLLCADSLVQVLPKPRGLIPVGILTSAIGGPLFISILRGERSLRR